MRLKIKQQKSNREVKIISIKDGTYIHRYDKPIRSFSYMCRVINK